MLIRYCSFWHENNLCSNELYRWKQRGKPWLTKHFNRDTRLEFHASCVKVRKKKCRVDVEHPHSLIESFWKRFLLCANVERIRFARYLRKINGLFFKCLVHQHTHNEPFVYTVRPKWCLLIYYLHSSTKQNWKLVSVKNF